MKGTTLLPIEVSEPKLYQQLVEVEEIVCTKMSEVISTTARGKPAGPKAQNAQDSFYIAISTLSLVVLSPPTTSQTTSVSLYALLR